jgi:hypothetical protein
MSGSYVSIATIKSTRVGAIPREKRFHGLRLQFSSSVGKVRRPLRFKFIFEIFIFLIYFNSKKI